MKNKKLEAAISYAKRGWQVIPIHGIKNGACTCNNPSCNNQGKHPITKNGLKSGTTDLNIITNWFTQYPDANIGVVCGEVSNICVIDIDDPDSEVLKDYDFHDTVVSLTGSGGYHYIYEHPKKKVKSKVGVLNKVDSRGDGSYIIVPPSNHISGDQYRWVNSPDDTIIEDCPEWWLDLLEAQEEVKPDNIDKENILIGGRNNALTSLGGVLRKQGLGYESIKSCLLARNQEACQPPLTDREVEIIAKSICNYPIKTQEEKEAEEIGKKFMESFLENKQQRIAESLKNYDIDVVGEAPEFLPSCGLIKEISDYIISQSERPLPLLAVGASISLLSSIISRKYRTRSGIRANAYIIGLADSGAGKNKALKIINKIANLSQADDYLGGSDIASGSGLLTAIEKHTARLFMLDEFGLWLKTISKETASTHKREIMQLLMELYSRSDDIYRGKEYGDQKLKPRQDIVNPCVSIYGVSTPLRFNEALASGNSIDGSLSRMIVIPESEKRPDRARPEYTDVPKNIVEKIKRLKDYMPNRGSLSYASSSELDTIQPHIIELSEEIEEAWIQLDEDMTELMTDEVEKAIYSRVAENTMKLAMIHAVSINYTNPQIDHVSFTWARDIVLWCANKVVERVRLNISDNETEKISKRLEEHVYKEKENGISHSVLRQRAGRSIRPYEYQGYIDSLLDMGIIFKYTKESEKGRPTTRYYHAIFYKKVVKKEQKDIDKYKIV